MEFLGPYQMLFVRLLGNAYVWAMVLNTASGFGVPLRM
jgi:hypothetical protein